jgi:L-aminopeptidase/D-esterase-like protein
MWMLSNTQCDNADASVIEDPYPIWQPPRQPNFYRARYEISVTTIGVVAGDCMLRLHQACMLASTVVDALTYAEIS